MPARTEWPVALCLVLLTLLGATAVTIRRALERSDHTPVRMVHWQQVAPTLVHHTP